MTTDELGTKLVDVRRQVDAVGCFTGAVGNNATVDVVILVVE